LISSIKVSRRAHNISHLLFVGDNLLFFKLDEGQARQVSELILAFEKGTGQLSPAKCSLLVRQGAYDVMVNQVRQILGVERSEFDAKYLGLPMPEGRMHRGGGCSIHRGTVCEARGGLERAYIILGSQRGSY
jgi:hypothetical protein